MKSISIVLRKVQIQKKMSVTSDETLDIADDNERSSECFSQSTKESDESVPQSFSESIKRIAGKNIGESLPDDAAEKLSERIIEKIKLVVEDAAKFMRHSMRTTLQSSDIDHALKLRNQKSTSNPMGICGFKSEEEIDLTQFDGKTPLNLAPEPTYKAHWLAIDGVQPTVPENPPPISKELQKLYAVNPLIELEHMKIQNEFEDRKAEERRKRQNPQQEKQEKKADQPKYKPLDRDQEWQFKEITEACMNDKDSERIAAFRFLSTDTSIKDILHSLCTFICNGVNEYVLERKLSQLYYLMHMARALFRNPSLDLEDHLDMLIPAVISCIIDERISARSDFEEQFEVRSFSAELLAAISRKYRYTASNIHTRLAGIFNNILKNEKLSLTTWFGAITGLGALGPEDVEQHLIPYIQSISRRIEPLILTNKRQFRYEQITATRIGLLLQKYCPPVLKNIRSPPDHFEDYRKDYGFMGKKLYEGVISERTKSPSCKPTRALDTPLNLGVTASSVVRGLPSKSLLATASAVRGMKSAGMESSSNTGSKSGAVNSPAVEEPPRIQAPRTALHLLPDLTLIPPSPPRKGRHQS